MSRSLNKLTDVFIRSSGLRPGRHSDGGGLYLNVSSSGSKSWLFMWVKGRKRREMGLGPYPAVSLSKARMKASHCRMTVEGGGDPIADKRKEAEPTFGEAADQLIATMEGAWRNDKHRYQWKQTLGAYCEAIRGKQISAINTEDVLQVLLPIWHEKSETASRLRGRIERVIDFSKAKGWRTGENPALWRGHLRNVLPAIKGNNAHLPAMPFRDVAAFLAKVRFAEAMAARALEFTILTAARSGEARGATWSEIDFEQAIWVVPAERMKAGKVHRVPLSRQALRLLRELADARSCDLVFPGQRQGKPLSIMTMLMLMRRMQAGEFTVHGFRSSFRDWCGDCTSFPREIAEAALAHRVGDAVEQAYRRQDALEKRRGLMQAWADFVNDPGSAGEGPESTRGIRATYSAE